jgi:hypothetical protein
MVIMEDHPVRFLSHRSLLVKFALLVVCAIVPFAVVWSIRGERVIPFTIQSNYWFAAAIFAAAAVFLIRELVKAGRSRIVSWIGGNRWGIVLALALAVFMQVSEPHRAKVLYDEDLICGVAYMMHTEQMSSAPVRMHEVNGSPIVMDRSVDKRPVGFPFVLSLLHDWTGYRYSNVFVLNATLGFVLLLALYAWARPLTGAWGAAGILMLLCSLPLLAQNATASGFEVFNLCMILLFALAARRYLSKSGAEGLDLFICVALVLSIARYESILYLLALVAVVLVKWAREHRVTLTWFGALSPLFLFSALTSFHAFMGHDAFFQADNDKFLSFSHLGGNLLSAYRYMTAAPAIGQTNSLLLTGVGLASVLIFAGCIRRILRRDSVSGDSVVVLCALAAVVAVNTLIGLMENMGQWEAQNAARFSLPMHLFLVLSVAAVLPFVASRRRWVVVAVPAVAVGWLVLITAHQNARHLMTDAMPSSLECEWLRQWADANATKRDLIVDDSAMGMILHGHPDIPFEGANRAPWKLKALLDEKLYAHVYVCETYKLSADLKTWEPMSVCDVKEISPSVKMKTLAEARIKYNTMVRVSELVDVVDPEALAHRRPEDPKALAKWLGDIYP